jgi:hypothetical protein
MEVVRKSKPTECRKMAERYNLMRLLEYRLRQLARKGTPSSPGRLSPLDDAAHVAAMIENLADEIIADAMELQHDADAEHAAAEADFAAYLESQHAPVPDGTGAELLAVMELRRAMQAAEMSNGEQHEQHRDDSGHEQHRDDSGHEQHDDDSGHEQHDDADDADDAPMRMMLLA